MNVTAHFHTPSNLTRLAAARSMVLRSSSRSTQAEWHSRRTGGDETVKRSPAETQNRHHGLVTETLVLAAVRDAAERFRKAIQMAAAQDGLGEVLTAFRQFPAGSCGKATAMLCVHLLHSGLGDWRYVMGAQSGEAGLRTHAWATLGGFVLDITGSQFPGRPDIWLDEPDAWFTEWESGPPQRAHWDEDPSTDEGRGLQLVLKYL